MEIRMEKVKAEEKEILHRLLQYSLYEESGTDQKSAEKNKFSEGTP